MPPSLTEPAGALFLLAAAGFLAIKRAHGPDALAGYSSAKCTNEDNYVLQKFARAAMGTNNIDHCARL